MKNKTVKLEIRLPESEKERVRKKAKSANLTMSEFARQCMLKGKVKDYRYLIKLIAEINSIGNNINQATKILNQYNMGDDRDYDFLYAEFMKLKALIQKELLGEI